MCIFGPNVITDKFNMETWLPGRQVKVYHMVFHTGLVNYEITHSVLKRIIIYSFYKMTIHLCFILKFMDLTIDIGVTISEGHLYRSIPIRFYDLWTNKTSQESISAISQRSDLWSNQCSSRYFCGSISPWFRLVFCPNWPIQVTSAAPIF